MALTDDGKQLTEAHRVGQLAIAAQSEAAARLLWPALDPHQLDRSEPAWLAAELTAMRPFYEDSNRLAAAYLAEYRDAEGVPAGPLVTAPWNQSLMAANLHMAGPVRVKLLTEGGMSADAAAAGALTKFSGIFRRGVLSGGRLTIHETSRQDKRTVGWRRVTDGDPCTFCGMVASRGPVYGKETVLRTGEGLRYHGHCGCTAELVYGEWEPSTFEQHFIDEYNRAAEEVDALNLPRTQEHVLPRMRRNGMFRDSPKIRNQTPSP